ncbi:protein kinase [Spirosoma soli]|uniref:Protein kinase n=1 Tax=Spirosoma soli TaxID=1770529 RepID=A0ABW5M8N5_9BACT
MSTIRFNTQFPGYEVLSELGRSNARILKARHLDTGDLVAIKHFALNTDAETLRRFQRESAIMTSISHPNVVKVREVQLEAELPYIVMELIEGGSLRQLIKQQERLDVPTTIRMGLQMAAAFKAIHPQGIVHRDIKPENILYRPLPSGELHFLLTDFGVARLHEQSNTLTGQSLMTYEYASPEQFNNPKGVGVATDYYSLGVVLYECLQGHVPFSLNDHTGIVTFMNKVLNDDPPALTVTTNDQALDVFADLLDRLLKKKADERLSDADELTWLLKQAELNYIQASRAGYTKAKVTTSPAPAAQIEPNTEQVSQPAVSVPITDPASVPPRQARKATSGSGVKIAALVLVVLLGAVGLYYALVGFGSKPNGILAKPTQSGIADAASGNDDSSIEGSAEDEDTLSLRLAQEAQRREQLRQEAIAAGNNLRAEVDEGYRVGFFGGIKNVQITLNNPSAVAFPAVAVQVSYYKDNGDIYKTEKVFFMNVAPNSSPVRTAPDSDRGVRLSCKVLKYDLPEELDSMSAPTVTDSLN